MSGLITEGLRGPAVCHWTTNAPRLPVSAESGS